MFSLSAAIHSTLVLDVTFFGVFAIFYTILKRAARSPQPRWYNGEVVFGGFLVPMLVLVFAFGLAFLLQLGSELYTGTLPSAAEGLTAAVLLGVFALVTALFARNMPPQLTTSRVVQFPQQAAPTPVAQTPDHQPRHAA